MKHANIEEVPVPSVKFKGREWAPGSASMEAEAETLRQLAPYNRNTTTEQFQKVAEGHAEMMVAECDALSTTIGYDLAFPTMVTRLPMVRDQLVRTLGELAALKAMTESFTSPELRRADMVNDEELTHALAAIELDRLQKENAELKARLEATPAPTKARRKPAKKAKSVDLPKPLFERMNGSVNGHHATNGKH